MSTRDSEVSEEMAGKIVTYWLIPAEPARSYLRSLIRELALRWEAPVFEPHVTLYGTEAAQENPAAVLQSALTDFKPLRLSVAGIDYSDKFTKTLYVQFQPDAALRRLSEKLRACSVSQREYELNPHLSLLYKTMPKESKAEIARSLTLSLQEVLFDSAQAVISPADIKSREEVEGWRVVAVQKLSE